MFGRKLLVSFADGEGLRTLNETSRPFGIFLDIHDGYLPVAKPPLMPAAVANGVGRPPEFRALYLESQNTGQPPRQLRATSGFGGAVRGKARSPSGVSSTDIPQMTDIGAMICAI
jgi:hypothetical protein